MMRFQKHVLSVDAAWRRCLERVRERGETVGPRGLGTRELTCDLVVTRAENAVVTLPARDLGYRFVAHHAWWHLIGSDRVADAPAELARYSDDGETLFGAYGPPLVGQLDHVLDALTRDPGSRQAVVGIWRESPPATRDCPCTLTVQHLIRGGRLDLVVSMRSSDAWLGLPNDLATFAAWAAFVALGLRERGARVELGTLANFAGSRHVYEGDAARVDALLADGRGARSIVPLRPDDFRGPDELVAHLAGLAGTGPRGDVVTGAWLSDAVTWPRG